MKGEILMIELTDIYRWCDNFGGGLVIAASIEDARKKLDKKYPKRLGGTWNIWPWKHDDYYDENNVDVLDIYS